MPIPALAEAATVAVEAPQVPVAIASQLRTSVLAARGTQGPTPVVGQPMGVPARGRARATPVRTRVRRSIVLA